MTEATRTPHQIARTDELVERIFRECNLAGDLTRAKLSLGNAIDSAREQGRQDMRELYERDDRPVRGSTRAARARMKSENAGSESTLARRVAFILPFILGFLLCEVGTLVGLIVQRIAP